MSDTVGCGSCRRSLIESAPWDDMSTVGSPYRDKPVCFHCFMAINNWHVSDETREAFRKRLGINDQPKGQASRAARSSRK